MSVVRGRSTDSLDAADARWLGRFMQRAARCAIAAEVASTLVLAGCESTAEKEPPWGEGVSFLRCNAEGKPQLVRGMKLVYDVDYIAQLVGSELLSERGERCASALDRSMCLQLVSGTVAIDPGGLLTIEGDAIRVWRMPEALELLGEIDSAEEAFWVAQQKGYRMPCGRKSSETASGFRIETPSGPGPGVVVPACTPLAPTAPTVDVGRDGSVVEPFPTPQAPADCVPPIGPTPGRRPAGLCGSGRARAHSVLGDHFARAAHMEAASVPAFAAIARELHHHRAPSGLWAAAEAARRDEMRHAWTMSRLARRHGALPAPAIVVPQPPRSPIALALDNAVEGCVNEAYAALEATYQAAAARDPQTRCVHAAIAVDETRHAAFSFALDAWIAPRLTRAERAQVQAARRGAVERLGENLAARSVPDEVAADAGVPRPITALALHEQLARRVWA